MQLTRINKTSCCLIFVWLLFLVPIDAHATDFSPVHSLLEKEVSTGFVAGGSVLILHHGEVVFGEGFGYADLKTKLPFQLNTPVVIASISKPLIGTVAFRLSEKGKLDLAQPISGYLDEFKSPKLESGVELSRAPTMIELLTHTSGIRNDQAPGGRPWFNSITESKPLAEVVKIYAAEFPFKSNPGVKFAYSGIGTDVAARVLEVAGQRTRNELLLDELAKPLGMTQTFYRNNDSIKVIDHMPTKYQRNQNGNLVVVPNRSLPLSANYSSSGGSIISTPYDLARWLLMIRNHGKNQDQAFLTPETIAKMTSAFPVSQCASGGLFIRKKNKQGKTLVIGHSGSTGTDCWIDFEKDIIVIMLTQTEGMKTVSEKLEQRIHECIVEP